MIAYPWVHGNGDAAAAAAAAISLIPSTTTMTTLPREPKLCVHLVGSACILLRFFFSISTGKSFPLLGFFLASFLADPAAGAVEAAVPASCQSVSLLAFEELFLNVTYA